MNNSSLPPADDLDRALAERAALLGVPLWRVDAAGNLVGEPSQPAPLAAFLRSAPVRELILTAVTGLAKSETVEVAPGCWCVGVRPARGPRRKELFIGMLWLEAGLTTDAFARLCGESGASPESVAAALDPIVRGRVADVGRARASLQWSLDELIRAAGDAVTIKQIGDNLAQAYEETNVLFRLSRLMDGGANPAALLESVCRQIHGVMPFGWLALRFAEDVGLKDLRGRLMVAGAPPLDVAPLDALIRPLLQQPPGGEWTKLHDPRSSPLAAAVGSYVLAEPVMHGDAVIGVLVAGNRGGDPDVTSGEMQLIGATASLAGIFHENLTRWSEQETLFMGTLQALTASIDAKDPYTCGHSRRVSLLAAQTARAIGLTEAQAERYRIAGLVHDVGKIGVPETVLCKPARLSDDEFALIKKHPETGYRILKDIPALADVLPGVLHHHEKWNGQGYPHGLAGEQIPLLARVLALADTFDAMSSTRAYRPALPRETVVTELRRCAGTHFDPGLVELFVGMNFAAFDAQFAREAAGRAHAA